MNTPGPTPHGPPRPAAWLGWLGAVPVLALALYLMRPVLRGGAPISSDHMAHLFQAWDLWSQRLPWRIGGWSEWWFFGYPANELYHPGGDLWVAAWRAATLGLLDWADSYALAFVAFFAFAGLALYRYGARELGWLAGMIGAALFLLDRGEYEQGGWLYTVRAGVWPQALGLAFFFAGLVWLDRALDRGRLRDLTAAGLLLGAGVLAHPMDLVLMGLCLPLPWLARVLTRRKAGQVALLAPAAMGLLGAGLAAFWWVPLAARTGWTEAVGYPWLGLGEILAGLARGEIFPGTPGWVVHLGLLGGLLALIRRRPGGVLLALLFGLLMFLAAAEVSQGLAELTGSDALARFQYRRFTIPAKACLFLLAGYPVQSLLDGLWGAAGRLPAPGRPWARTGGGALVLGLALTLGALGWQAPGLRAHVESLDLPTTADGKWTAFQELSGWLADHHRDHPGFWRIAYEGPEHEQFFWAGPVYNGIPGYKPGFTCCRIFGGIPQGDDDALYRALSVRLVVSQGPRDRAGLRLLHQHGEFHVYAFEDYRAERWTLEGAGEIEALRFDPEHIQLQLRGTGPDSRLRLHVAHYSRWRATLDGEPLAIGAAPPSPGQGPILMELPARDGLLELRYRRELIDWLGMLFSLLALLTAAGLMLRGGALPGWLGRYSSPPGSPNTRSSR